MSSAAWTAYGGHVGAAFAAHGAALVRMLLVSAAGSCPRHLVQLLAGCLFGLVTSLAYRGAVAEILPAVIMSPDYPAVKEGLLKVATPPWIVSRSGGCYFYSCWCFYFFLLHFIL
jgi:hypothetical protein